jgi:phospholipase/carboxylesterase
LLTRRSFLATSLLAPSLACELLSAQSGAGRLRARVRPGARASIGGERSLALGLDSERDALLKVPADVSRPLPLLVAFHGAGQSARWMLDTIAPHAAGAGVAVLAPYSRSSSWDAIRGRYSVDVEFIDRALEKTFSTIAVDPTRIALGGFSDGATYALSLGRINGDAFRKVIAFSPGFVVDGTPAGKPEFFITHGTVDPILPIERCSRRIVPALRSEGYAVTYKEFVGGHTVEPGLADEAMRWLASPSRA